MLIRPALVIAHTPSARPCSARVQGYSLVELLIGLAVISLLVALAFTRYNAYKAEQTDAIFAANLQQFAGRLATNFRSPAMEYGSYTDTGGRAIAPPDFVAGTSYRNPVAPSGSLSVAAVTLGGVTNGSLQITASGFSVAQCIDVTMKTYSSFARVLIGTTTVKGSPTATLSPSQLTGPCGTSTTITWVLL
jgi:prepilin-type N-terminal cleavage/methylation domain-containing protein